MRLALLAFIRLVLLAGCGARGPGGGEPAEAVGAQPVQGHQTASSTTWGAYRLVGTYDGALLTVLQVDRPAPVRWPSAAERFNDEPKSACPEPEGGWPMPDPARRSEQDLEPVTEAVRAEPDFAGVWLSYLEPMGHDVAEEPGEFVLNVAFTATLSGTRPRCDHCGVDGCASRASSAPTADCWRSNVSCTAPLALSLACKC